MTANERVEKFAETLADLLSNASVSEGGRKQLAQGIGLSETTVSHYVRGRVKPSFEALTAIAQYFNVSLDFLVFGERLPVEASAGQPHLLLSQIQRAIVEARDDARRKETLTTRVIAQLERRIDVAVSAVLDEHPNFGVPGFLTDTEAIAIERCARKLSIMTNAFQSDMTPTGQPGPFLGVMTENISDDRPYQYLLAGVAEDWRESAARLRTLVEEAVGKEKSNEFLRFRVATIELVSSVCILDLDVPLLERTEPTLYERISDHIGTDGKWAYISVERQDASGGLSIEPFYFPSTMRLFDTGWKNGKPL